MALVQEFKFVVDLDLDDSGSFVTDISAYLKEVGFREGRSNFMEAFGGCRVDLTLDNEDSRFSPQNTGSPYSPNLKRGKYVRVRAQFPNLAAVTNICENPSIETDTVGWVTSGAGGLARDTTQARYGKACLRVDGHATGAGNTDITKRSGSRFDVTASQDYTVYMKVRVTGNTVNFGVSLWWYNSGGTLISISSSTDIFFRDGGPWRKIANTDTAPVGAVTCLPRLIDTSGALGVGDKLFVDGAIFYQSNDQDVPYCDGSLAGCSWSGTAHESTSSRPAAPYFGVCVGRIGDIRLRRRDNPIAEMDIVAGSMEWAADPIDAGSFAIGDNGELCLHRVIDRIQGDIGITEQAFTDGDLATGTQEADNWTALGSTKLLTNAIATNWIEGDLQLKFTLDGVALGEGGRRDVTSETVNEWDYDVSAYLLRIGPLPGSDIKLRIADQAGEISAVNGSLASTDLRLALESVQWPATSTSRYVEVVTTATEDVGDLLVLTAWTIQETRYALRRNLGTGREKIEQITAFQRAGRATLSEMAASLGGWVRLEMDDSPATTSKVVFETIAETIGGGNPAFTGDRQAAPIPGLRLTDSDEGDGLYFEETDYSERLADHYNIVRVYSLGNEDARPILPIWQLEPTSGVSFGANETRRFHMNPYMIQPPGAATGGAEADEIPIKAVAVNVQFAFTFSAGGGSVDAFRNYGVGGYVDIKKDGTAGSLAKLVATGKTNVLASERYSVENDKRVDTTMERPRVLRIDVLAAGASVGSGVVPPAMAAVRDYFADRVYHPKPHLAISWTAPDIEGALALFGNKLSTPVQVRHNTGRGHFGLDAPYYIEGREIHQDFESLPDITYHLSPA